MPPERYTIGPKLLGDIRQTITRVDAIAPRTSGPHQEPRLQTLNNGLRLYRGTFTQSTWAVGATMAVAIEGTSETVSVTNYCVPVYRGTEETQSQSVIFGAVQGTMSVLEVQAPSPVRIGTFTPPWNKGSTAAVTLLAGGGTVEASNLFATVTTTNSATTSLHCAVAMDGTTRYLIAAECDE